MESRGTPNIGIHGYGKNLVAGALRNVLVAWSLDPFKGI